jgi:hypothetical protein
LPPFFVIQPGVVGATRARDRSAVCIFPPSAFSNSFFCTVLYIPHVTKWANHVNGLDLRTPRDVVTNSSPLLRPPPRRARRSASAAVPPQWPPSRPHPTGSTSRKIKKSRKAVAVGPAASRGSPPSRARHGVLQEEVARLLRTAPSGLDARLTLL